MVLEQVDLAEEARASWASGVTLYDFPNTPWANLNDPMIVVFPVKCRVSVEDVGELTMRPLWWPSCRAGDEFTVEFSGKDGRFVSARRDDLCALARTMQRLRKLLFVDASSTLILHNRNTQTPQVHSSETSQRTRTNLADPPRPPRIYKWANAHSDMKACDT
jgi:hypothetical protein